jgi:hypothetical protein
MLIQVRSVDEGVEAMEYFNASHDGFIKRFLIMSQDYFLPDKSQMCTGSFNAELDFAHYNYREGQPPPNQLIRAVFIEVQDALCDFRDALHSLPITKLEVVGGTRVSGNSTEPEPCLVLHVTNKLLQDGQWVPRTYQMFTFKEAVFSE